MAIENGGEIDAGDGNCLVTARGTKDGLIIRMDGRAEIGALQQALESFLNNRHSFLQGNEVFLEWVGAKPSADNRDKVANLFRLHGVKVFSSRGVAEREGDQRREEASVAYKERLEGRLAVGDESRSELRGDLRSEHRSEPTSEWYGSDVDDLAPTGRTLFDGVRSLGLGRGGFSGEDSEYSSLEGSGGKPSGDFGSPHGHASLSTRSGGASAKISSMARFSQIVGESDFEDGVAPDRAGAERFLAPRVPTSHGDSRGYGERSGKGELRVFSDLAAFESNEGGEFDLGDPDVRGSDLDSSKRGSLKAKALASLGRAATSAPSCRDLGAVLDPESQLERAFAEKIMSSNEDFLGSELRSSYGMEGSAWDDADARIVVGTVRSGQRIETEHSLVILGDVNSGGEIVAGGDIIVLGTLRGVAHAGAFEESGGGRIIVAMDLQPTQLRIGNVITRGGAESSQVAATAVGGMRASLGFGSSKAQGAAAKAQQALKAQVGAKGPSAMEVAWVEGSTIVVEPYQSRGVGLGRRGVR